MKKSVVLIAALLCASRAWSQQSAAEHVALGDKEHASNNIARALAHYQAAIRVDSNNVGALIKAAYDAVDLGEFDPSEPRRDTLYREAEAYSRRAIALDSTDAEGHFQLARALGRRALTMGKRDQVKFASEVYNQAQAAIRINPKHAGAIHVMGVWNEHIMQLNGLTRMLAKTLLGGKVFGEASWDKAQADMEQAVALEPNRITHHLDLGAVYADRDLKEKAKEQYEWMARAPASDYNDVKYKELAARRLKDLQ
jgi:tetratricopeptide (TPR) repeat protein